MNVSAIRDLHYKLTLKILSKLHEPLSKCKFLIQVFHCLTQDLKKT